MNPRRRKTMAERNQVLRKYARRSPSMLLGDGNSALELGKPTMQHLPGPPAHSEELAAEIADVIRKAIHYLPDGASAVREALTNFLTYESAESLMNLAGDLWDRLALVN